jgi:hypothetical protein
MEISTTYCIGNQQFHAIATHSDLSWGNGIKVSIYDASGVIWGEAIFRCRPEFPDFEQCQKMDTAQLLQLAVEHLLDGGHPNIESVRSNGVKITCCLNCVKTFKSRNQ